jgi:predicted transglutaminase-like cysteine proteinase
MSTELVIQSDKTVNTLIRDGIQGNYDIVFQMVRLVRQAIQDKNFQSFINKTFRDRGFNANSDKELLLQDIFKYVNSCVSYASDPAGRIENIKLAQVTLSDGYGDCDDFSILYASILGVLGFEPSFVLAMHSPAETQFSHVYVETESNNKRYVFDGALPDKRFNSEVAPLKSVSIDILNQNETDTFTGFIKSIGLAAQGLYKNALDIVPTLAGFTPIGFAAYAVLQTGAGIASAGLQKDVSLSELGTKINAQLDEIIKALNNSQIAHNWAVSSAAQISAQLAAYKPKNKVERDNFPIIAASIKNKYKYIENFNKTHDYNVNLNQKGMAIAGMAVVGYFGYRAYKELSK